jgi:hypothetical protein
VAAVTAFTFDAFLLEMAKGKNGLFDLTANPLHLYLTNNTPDRATHVVPADLPGIASKNGYSGMVALTITSRSITGNAYKIVGNGQTWTGTDATDSTGFGPFRYAVLAAETSTGVYRLIGYLTYPSSVTVPKDGIFSVEWSSLTGILSLAALV